MDLTRTAARIGARLLRTRWFVRAPVRLYRLGLGPVLGRRVLMLEHRGRTTGLPRTVVLEVIALDHGAPVVVSGFGERAQWCRNVPADPDVRVWWGTRRPRPGHAVRLGPARARGVIGDYARAHPRAWRSLRATMEEASGTTLDRERFTLPMFAVRDSADPEPLLER